MSPTMMFMLAGPVIRRMVGGGSGRMIGSIMRLGMMGAGAAALGGMLGFGTEITSGFTWAQDAITGETANGSGTSGALNGILRMVGVILLILAAWMSFKILLRSILVVGLATSGAMALDIINPQSVQKTIGRTASFLMDGDFTHAGALIGNTITSCPKDGSPKPTARKN